MANRTLKANKELRAELERYKIPVWMLADAINMPLSTLNCKLRHELPDDEKARMMSAIEQIRKTSDTEQKVKDYWNNISIAEEQEKIIQAIKELSGMVEDADWWSAESQAIDVLIMIFVANGANPDMDAVELAEIIHEEYSHTHETIEG